MTTNAVTKTPEERKQAIADIKTARKTEDLTLAKACEKVGITVWQFYQWSKKGKKGVIKRRRKKTPIVVNALVPVKPHTEEDGFNELGNKQEKPNAAQVALLLAQMNAASLRTLLRGEQ